MGNRFSATDLQRSGNVTPFVAEHFGIEADKGDDAKSNWINIAAACGNLEKAWAFADLYRIEHVIGNALIATTTGAPIDPITKEVTQVPTGTVRPYVTRTPGAPKLVKSIVDIFQSGKKPLVPDLNAQLAEHTDKHLFRFKDFPNAAIVEQIANTHDALAFACVELGLYLKPRGYLGPTGHYLVPMAFYIETGNYPGALSLGNEVINVNKLRASVQKQIAARIQDSAGNWAMIVSENLRGPLSGGAPGLGKKR